VQEHPPLLALAALLDDRRAGALARQGRERVLRAQPERTGGAGEDDREGGEGGGAEGEAPPDVVRGWGAPRSAGPESPDRGPPTRALPPAAAVSTSSAPAPRGA
jgi:hypothetical protein